MHLDELYLTARRGFPAETERVRLLAYVGGSKDRRARGRDVAWGW